MKIVFFMRYYSYIAHYEETLRALAGKGHHIHFAFNNRHRKPFDEARMKALFGSISHTSFDFFPEARAPGVWARFAELNRALIDFLRYAHPDYAHAPKLRRRFERKVHPFVRFFFWHVLFRAASFQVWIRFLRGLERLAPLPQTALNYLQSHRADLVLFTPLLDSNTGFIDYAKAARSLGIRTAVCVASWDNLTNKGLIQAEPDAVVVWNAFQKEEAVKYHGVPSEKVFVTGAQTFDKWFERRPSLSKEEFLRKVGLAPDRDFLVYACSSQFIAENEVSFVRKWIETIRARRAFDALGLLVRPHPAHIRPWEGVDFSQYRDVIIYPRWRGVPYPFTEGDKSDYFDCLYHMSALVGVNTSAMIEAGIQTKPVFTILGREFKDSQEGTRHFFLIKDNGLLSTARNLEEHARQLEEVLRQDGRAHERIRSFIREFVRPHGMDKPATLFVTQALETVMAFARPSPAPEPALARVSRVLLYPFLAAFNISFNANLLRRNFMRTLHKTWKQAKNFGKRVVDFVRVKIFRNEPCA